MWLSLRQAPLLNSSVCQPMSPEGWHTPPPTAASAHRCQCSQDNQQIRTGIARCSPATENLNADTTAGKTKKPQASPAGNCLSPGSHQIPCAGRKQKQRGLGSAWSTTPAEVIVLMPNLVLSELSSHCWADSTCCNAGAGNGSAEHS